MISRVHTSETDRELLCTIPVRPDDLDDGVGDYSKVVVRKPWGYEYLLFANEHIAVWILYLKPGAQTSMHCHPSKKTSLVVLQGQAICSTVSEEFDRSPGDGLLIDKGCFHQTKAVSEAGAFVMEIETPLNKRDLVRLRDQYGREGQGYEHADRHSANLQNYNYLSVTRSDITYNFRKRFGQCTLTFQRLRQRGELASLRELPPEDVVSVLRGRLVDAQGRTRFELGDTVTVRDLQEVPELRIGEPLELLVIKRIDTLIKVSDVVAEFLKEQRVRQLFLVPGEATVHLLDSIGREPELSFLCCQDEHSAALAAEAYAKLTRELGVAVVSSGGSALKALTGIGNAWADSTPVLVLSGQTRTDQYAPRGLRQLDNKSLNIVELARPITKYAVTVTDPTAIRAELERAAHLARNGRPGPVWVDLPIDVQGMTIDATELKAWTPPAEAPGRAVNSRSVDRALAWLREARRPVLLAGNGIRIAEAEAAFLELVGALQIPVLTSRRGADLIPEDHPLFFGRPGVYGQRRANFVIQNADLVLSLGSRLSVPLVGRNYRAFARAARKIVVDIDPRELRKPTVQPDLRLPMDAGVFIGELLRRGVSAHPAHAPWLARCREWSRRFPPLGLLTEANGSGGLMAHRVVAALSEVLDEGDILVVDGGSPVHSVMQSFRVKAGQQLISSTGLELPGFALPGAVGASAAGERSRVVCLCEDRGFLIGVPALQTMRDYRLPVKMFVFKTRGDSNLRKIQRDYFGKRYVGTDLEQLFGAPKLGDIARAYELTTIQVRRPDELAEGLRSTLEAPGPAICELWVEDDQDLMPRIGFVVKDDGKWIAKPLEDMYPYLDRETLQENMLIELVEED